MYNIIYSVPGPDTVPAEVSHRIRFRGGSPARASKVTVAISLYNYENHILECLDSVGSQTVEHLDLVVVDDGSGDRSAEVARGWLARHETRFDRCLLLQHVENRGLAATRNLLFQHARTEYVFVLDADNLIYPRCLETLAAALDRCDASFAHCYLEMFGAASSLMGLRPWDPEALRDGNLIDAMTMLRKRTWEDLGGYATDMPVMGWEDFDFWLKLAARGGWGVHVPEVLARYRVHPSSMLRTQTYYGESALW